MDPREWSFERKLAAGVGLAVGVGLIGAGVFLLARGSHNDDSSPSLSTFDSVLF
jgi:hypothetical protein